MAATYQWYFNAALINGATGEVYIAIMNGDYSVVVTNSYGCSSTSSMIQIVLNGITALTDGAYVIYPNPVNDYLEIDFSTLTKTSKAELTDVLGKVLWNESIATNASKKMIIDMSKMSKNVYFLTIYYDDKRAVSKIIKE